MIEATFSDFRIVKGRKQLQLVFEVPIERMKFVLDELGAPGIATDNWCKIMPHQASASERPPTVHAAQQRVEETAAPSKPHRDWSSLPLSQQCAIRCRDQQFQKWFLGSGYETHKDDAAQWTVRMIHEALGWSRKLLDDDPVVALKWRNTNARYEAWLTTQAHAETYR